MLLPARLFPFAAAVHLNQQRDDNQYDDGRHQRNKTACQHQLKITIEIHALFLRSNAILCESGRCVNTFKKQRRACS